MSPRLFLRYDRNQSKPYQLSDARFAQVERAPASTRPKLPEREPFNYGFDSQRRWALQSEFETEATELRQTLEAQEAGNFVQLRIEWEPEFHYLILFKTAPKDTLARYTQNPIFKATNAPFTEAELTAHMEIIYKRLTAHNAVNGAYVDALNGKAKLDTGMTREEFDAIPALADLHDDPKIKLGFMALFEPPEAIDPALAPHIRYLSRANHLNGVVLTSLTKGRVVLRDGCFFLDTKNNKDPLVHFHKEVGIGFDDEGYIVLINRIPNVSIENRFARVGELAGWGDGIRDIKNPDVITPLQNACGVHPVVNIGTPSSRFGEG